MRSAPRLRRRFRSAALRGQSRHHSQGPDNPGGKSALRWAHLRPRYAQRQVQVHALGQRVASQVFVAPVTDGPPAV